MKDEKQTKPKAKKESVVSAGPEKKSKAPATVKPGTLTKEGKKAAKKVEKKAAKDVKTHVAAGKPEKKSAKKAAGKDVSRKPGKASTGKKAASAPSSISPEERQQWIREAAFFRSQRRGFGEGNPNDDWAAAEADRPDALGKQEAPGLSHGAGAIFR